MTLRVLTILLSLSLHCGLAAMFIAPNADSDPTDVALEAGTAEDALVIEQGIEIEGLSKGNDTVTAEAVEAVQPQLQPVPVEEVKPVEDVQHVITSDAGPEQTQIASEPPPDDIKPVEEKKPEQVATAVVPPQVAVEERQAASQRMQGGDATALNAYRGALFTHISKKKVNPRSQVRGTATVRFSFDPATGALLTHEIVTSSGSAALDKAALDSVERAAPFPPVPINIAQGAYEVTVPFKFSVR